MFIQSLAAWHERLTCTQEDAGSNPARSTTTEHEPEDFQRCVDPKKTRLQKKNSENKTFLEVSEVGMAAQQMGVFQGL